MVSRVAAQERRAFSVSEAAAMLGLHRQTVAAAIRRGEIPAVRLGRKVLVPSAVIERLLEPTKSSGAEPTR